MLIQKMLQEESQSPLPEGGYYMAKVSCFIIEEKSTNGKANYHTDTLVPHF